MDNKEHIFIVYDQVAKFEGKKHKMKDKLYSTLSAHAKALVVHSSRDFFRPEDTCHIHDGLYRLRREFSNKDNTEIHPIIYNGNELGCRFFYDLLKRYNLHQNLVYIDESVHMGGRKLRFMKQPLGKDFNLGFSDFADDWFKENISKKIIKKIKQEIGEEATQAPKKVTPNTISIISQPPIAFDSLYPLKSPTIDFPIAIRLFLEEKYKNNFKNLKILWHLHPSEKQKDNLPKYNYDILGLPIDFPKGSTYKEVSNSELIIGWDSTTLFKLFFAGYDNIHSIKERHCFNYSKDRFITASKVNACTIKIDGYDNKDEFNKFISDKDTYQKLCSPNDIKFAY